MFKKLHVGALAMASATALYVVPSTAGAEDITVTAWGGAYTKSQEEAYYKPYTAKTGNKVIIQDYNGDLAEIQAQVKTGNVKWDVVDVELAEAIKGCEEGLFEKIDASKLPAGDNGTPAAKDFAPGLITPCAVATILYSNVVAYDMAKYAAKGPQTLNDYFDLAKFPGKRGMRKNPSVNMEWALLADGVAPADVYKVLATPAGVERAFKKLDTIKPSVVWWTAGAQPPQLLASGEVVMTSVYHGRIFDANQKDKRNFALVWDGQVQVPDLFVVVKGTKHSAAAQEFIRFATSTSALAEQAKWIPYAPARASSLAKIPAETKQWLPNGGHSGRQMLTSAEFWSEYGDDLNKRFNAWLAK